MTAQSFNNQWETRRGSAPGGGVRRTVPVEGVGDIELLDCWDLLSMGGIRFLARGHRDGESIEYLLLGAPLPDDRGDDLVQLICDECLALHRACVVWTKQWCKAGDGGKTGDGNPIVALLANRRLFPESAAPKAYEVRGGALQIVGWADATLDARNNWYTMKILAESPAGVQKCREIAKQIVKQANLRLESFELAWTSALNKQEDSQGLEGRLSDLFKACVHNKKEALNAQSGIAKSITEVQRVLEEIKRPKIPVSQSRGQRVRRDVRALINWLFLALAIGVTAGIVVWVLATRIDVAIRLTAMFAALAMLGVAYLAVCRASEEGQ